MAIKPQNKKFYDKNWKALSKKLIQEKGKCEICGRTKDEIFLTVHHKDRNPQNNNLNNLLVCCPRCHFHQEYLLNSGFNWKIQGNLFIKEGNNDVI